MEKVLLRVLRNSTEKYVNPNRLRRVLAVTKDILYSIAETSTGQLIKAIDADKKCAYICPGCKQPFVFRKGSRKRPHFAHKVLSPNCTPETALHYSFKTLFCEKITKYLALNLPLKIRWNCSNCSRG